MFDMENNLYNTKAAQNSIKTYDYDFEAKQVYCDKYKDKIKQVQQYLYVTLSSVSDFGLTLKNQELVMAYKNIILAKVSRIHNHIFKINKPYTKWNRKNITQHPLYTHLVTGAV